MRGSPTVAHGGRAGSEDSSGARLTLFRRVGWGVADQALSSLTNFGLTVLVARQVDTGQLGGFSLAFGTYLITLGISRALCTEPLMVRYSASTRTQWREGAAMAAGASLGTGMIAGIACLIAGKVLGGSLGRTFAVLGLSLPGLLLQDSWRYAFVAAGNPLQAFVNDLVWAVVLFPSVLGFIAIGHSSVVWLTLAWGGAATVAAVIGSTASSARTSAPSRRNPKFSDISDTATWGSAMRVSSWRTRGSTNSRTTQSGSLPAWRPLEPSALVKS